MEKSLRGSISSGNTKQLNKVARSYIGAPPDPSLSPLSLAFYKKSLIIEPDNVETHLGMARAYHALGKPEDARACCEKALSIEPGSIKALLFRCMFQIQVLYDSPEEVASSRRNYRRHLDQLMEMVKKAPARIIAPAAEAIGDAKPFYLQYQGHNDSDLQRTYGNLVSHMLAVRYPQWTKTPKTAPPRPKDPIRVGIVFGFFRVHSAWKVILKGWVDCLNRERFLLTGYSLGSGKDTETEYAGSCFTKFVEGPMSLEAWGRTIRQDRPHVLIYPEIGMHWRAIQLAGLRLAPIQCASWGNFVTSGLPTIDYYISGEEIEPPGAETHYTEKLVKLPRLSIHYTPHQVNLEPMQHEDLGLRASAVVYFCAQSLFKYLPQFDAIFPRIARRVKDCQFVFRQHRKWEPITRQFGKRLGRVFSQYGLRKDDYVVMEPSLATGAYHALNNISDVFLDSIRTSGVTTTLEALAYDLPIVTRPGKFLRGYFGTAVLKRMGVTETIARSLDEYVEIAVRLGNDNDWRHRISKRMGRNKHKVYGDMKCIEGLESFLETVVREKS